MKSLKIGLGQVNPTVGAIDENADKIVESAHQLAGQGASVIVFPELCLSGYPPEDLVLKPHFIQSCKAKLADLAERLPGDPMVVIGAPTPGPDLPWNSAVVFSGRRQAAEYHKILLPNYGIFDEKRVFSAGERPMVIQIGQARIGIHICEDSWFTLPGGAGEGLGLNLLLNLSASPYHRGKLDDRESVLAGTATRMNCWLAYCNLAGGQDELVFDGASMVLSPSGALAARAKQFEEDGLCVDIPLEPGRAVIEETRELDAQWVFIDLGAFADAPYSDLTPARLEPALEERAEVYRALVTGLRDYVDKNGFAEVVIAISGGIDSALVSAIAVDALGAERVRGVTMPSQYSSAETLSDAEALAANLGIELTTLPIRELYDAFVTGLAPHWDPTPGLAEENLQARIRGNLIMALSNKMGWLVLTTGNKSEMATGYCTLYGDMAGGFAVIKDVPKTLVFELSRWRNEQGDGEVIPPSTIDRPPSAELRPDQKDTDSLPPYDVLDRILECYVERDLGLEDILAEGFDEDTVRRAMRLVDLSEYKRRQAPPGVRITPKAFGRDRRIPITNRYGN